MNHMQADSGQTLHAGGQVTRAREQVSEEDYHL
jgi:hypothetical protein